jgi:ADP-heptose:LPS heptosyltransferase
MVNLQEDCNFELNDLSSSVSDFQDSAEYIHAADLIISVDTSLLHLAGSNLAPTWGLLSKYSEWRWGNEPTKTVWYPTVKLFRQENVNNWDELFDRVEEELRKKVSETLGEVAWVA